MRLLNVRIGEDDARLVERLKARGVSISEVVRTAIREAAGKPPANQPLDTDALMDEMLRRYPTPASERLREGSAADRRHVQRVLRDKLLRKPKRAR